MGREVRCTARAGGQSGSGKALLETTELRFSGESLRFTIPYAELRAVQVEGGTLSLRTSSRVVELDLGAKEATAWARRIENPPSRLDKLGAKPGMKVAVVGPAPADL